VRECGVADHEADVIRLSVPADDALRPVVEVAVGVLARRWGLAEDEVAAARDAAADAFREVVGAGRPGTVDIVLQAEPGLLAVQLTHGAVQRSLKAPEG
jgi:hypothetical protein